MTANLSRLMAQQITRAEEGVERIDAQLRDLIKAYLRPEDAAQFISRLDEARDIFQRAMSKQRMDVR